MKLHFSVSTTQKAQALFKELQKQSYFREDSATEADIIVVLGGDGFMLQALHQYQPLAKPVYGLNCGTVGFLMNAARPINELYQRIEKAVPTGLHPLRADVMDTNSKHHQLHAINEVTLLRQTPQASKIKIVINSETRLTEFVGDGLIVATPAGSTAYNFSAHGPILPLHAPLLALTPLSTYFPRQWKGALLPHTVKIDLEILESHHRAVAVTADTQTITYARHVHICQDNNITYQLLFDADYHLEERILKEQFYST